MRTGTDEAALAALLDELLVTHGDDLRTLAYQLTGEAEAARELLCRALAGLTKDAVNAQGAASAQQALAAVIRTYLGGRTHRGRAVKGDAARSEFPEGAGPSATHDPLAHLSRQQRAAVVLTYGTGLGPEQVAPALRRSASAVSADLRDGLAALERELGPLEESSPDPAPESDQSRFRPGSDAEAPTGDESSAVTPSTRTTSITGMLRVMAATVAVLPFDVEDFRDEVSQRRRSGRRRRTALVAAVTAVSLILFSAGAVTIVRLLDHSVDVALPDKFGRPNPGTAEPVDLSGYCGTEAALDAPTLRQSTGDLELSYGTGEPALGGWGAGDGWWGPELNPAGAISSSMPSLVLVNSSAAAVVTRGLGGFVVVKDGVVVAAPSSGADTAPVTVFGDSAAGISWGYSTCMEDLEVGSYLLYGVVPVSKAANDFGGFSPDDTPFLVVGRPLLVTITYAPNGADLETTVTDYDPSVPIPPAAVRPMVPRPAEVPLALRHADPRPLSVVWLASGTPQDVSEGSFIGGQGDAARYRLDAFGYSGFVLPLSCQPAAMEPLGFPVDDDPASYRGAGIAFATPEEAQEFTEQFAVEGTTMTTVTAEVVCG